MGYILFLTKHHDGFCLWDTKTTDRKVTKAPLGRDVLAELKKSCDKHGIKLALYFSEGDWDRGLDSRDGNEHAGQGRHEPGDEKGAAQGTAHAVRADRIHLVRPRRRRRRPEPRRDTVAFCKALQPGCFIGFNHGDQAAGDIRLGEMGRPGPLDGRQRRRFQRRPHERPYKGYRLAEFTYPILPNAPRAARCGSTRCRSTMTLCHPAEKLYRDYLGAVKYGNIFSLDVGPDYDGKLREIDVKTLREVGEMIRANAPISDVSKNPAPIQ